VVQAKDSDEDELVALSKKHGGGDDDWEDCDDSDDGEGQMQVDASDVNTKGKGGKVWNE